MQPLDRTNIEPASRLLVVRPLLGVSRVEIEAYLNERRLTFRLDRSNQDPSFLRNWIRLKLIPQLKEKMDQHLSARLAQQAELIRDEEHFLEEMARAELDRIQTAEGIDRGLLLKYSKALQRRILRVWIKTIRGHLRGLDFQHVEALLELIASGPPQGRLAIPGGWQLSREYQTIRLDKQVRGMMQQCACYSYNLRVGEVLHIREAGFMVHSREISPPFPRLPDNFMEAMFDRASLAAELTLRNFRRGDRVQLLGMNGHKKLKELFIEKKVPLSVRASLPLLTLGNAVIWVPGHARSEVGKVTPATRVILHLKAVPLRN